MKLISIAALFLAMAIPVMAIDSATATFFGNAASAAAHVAWSPYGQVIPVPMTPSYDPWLASTNRISWVAVRTAWPSGSNNVPSMNPPLTWWQRDSWVQCPNGDRINAASGGGLYPTWTTSHFSTHAAWEAAYAALGEPMRSYSVKLALPFGNEVKYVLVTPGANIWTASVVCSP